MAKLGHRRASLTVHLFEVGDFVEVADWFVKVIVRMRCFDNRCTAVVMVVQTTPESQRFISQSLSL